MSTNMLIDGYVANFKQQSPAKFYPKDQEHDYERCTLSVNISYGGNKNNNEKKQYCLVSLTGYNWTAQKLNEYKPGEHIICNADFNGLFSYIDRNDPSIVHSSINATVKNILLYPESSSPNNSNNYIPNNPNVNSTSTLNPMGQQSQKPELNSQHNSPNLETPSTNQRSGRDRFGR